MIDDLNTEPIKVLYSDVSVFQIYIIQIPTVLRQIDGFNITISKQIRKNILQRHSIQFFVLLK